MRAAKMDHDLGLAERPDDDSFDDMLLHVDGWLCEIKDVQIRDGLHVLGQRAGRADPARPGAGDPAGPPAVRPATRRCPACVRRSGWPRTARRTQPGRRRRAAGPRARQRTAGQRLGPGGRRQPHRRRRGARRSCGSRPPRWCPGWRGTAAEIDQVLRALDGRFIAAGPSGSPLRGLVNVLPTGRNFYSVDPKAVPVPAGLGDRCGDGRFAAGALPQRPRRLAAVGRAVGVGHLGDAHRRRRHRRSACAAGCPADVGRGVAAGGRPGADRRRRAGPARGSTSPCASPGSSATRSRTWSPCSTTRCALVAGLDEPAESQLRPRPRAGRPRRAW